MITNRNPPHFIGFVNASAIAELPTNRSVSTQKKQLLETAEISDTAYLGECYALCACAFLHTVRNAVSQEIAEEISQGFKQFLIQNKETSYLAYALEKIDEALTEYSEAAGVDPHKGEPRPGNMTEIELTFGDRLFNLAREDNETCATACFQLSIGSPRVFWDVYAKAAITELTNAQLITAH